MRPAILLAALAAVLLAQGCSSPARTYYEPSRTRGSIVDLARPSPEGGEPVETREFVPLEFAGAEVRVACQARISESEPVEGVRVATLHLRVWVHNYSKHRVEMRPKEFVAVDDIDRRFTPTEIRQDGTATTIVLARSPLRSSIDVIFRLPAGYDIRGSRSLKLLWGFRIDEREYRHETLFEAARDRGFHDPFGSFPTGRM